MKARYDRLVIILIDALRFDFVDPELPPDELPYFGQMSAIEELIHNKSENALLLHFMADAPTTTLQRLKGITTGSLPTFVEAGSNFMSTEIREDNLIDQFVRMNKSIIMLGDDTWVTMYPQQFKRKYHLPSFDVNDLHKVDNMIIGNIYNELRQDDWTLLIAHFLGVDHCGHKFGPRSGEMKEKLAQMNDIIFNVTQLLDNETLLVVFGDHGMTETGDHGGDALKEVDAALFLYSKKQLVFSQSDFYVSQIDIVPTLSLLIGLPIPFSNIGIFIANIFSRNDINIAARINFAQMYNYIKHLENSIPDLSEFLKSFNESYVDNDPVKQKMFMKNVQSYLRETWTNFDMQLMLYAFTYLISITVSIVDCLGRSELKDWNLMNVLPSLILLIFLYYYMQFSFILFLLTIINIINIVSKIRYFFELHLDFPSSFMLMTFIHAFSFLSNSYIVFESDVARFLTQSLFIVASGCLTENQQKSYVGHRNLDLSARKVKSLTFFDWLHKRRRFVYRFASSVVVLILLRIGKLFERCREEQQDACLETFFAVPLSKVPYGGLKVLRFFIGSISLLIIGIQFFRYLLQSNCERFLLSFMLPLVTGVIMYWGMDLMNFDQEYLVVLGMIVHFVCFLPIIKCSIVKVMRFSFAPKMQDECIIFAFLIVFLIFIHGDGTAFVFGCSLLIISLTFSFIDNEYCLLGVLSIFSSHMFFATSHQSTFSSIPWQAAFIGIPVGSLFLPAILVLIHIFSNQIFITLCLLFAPYMFRTSDDEVMSSERIIKRKPVSCIFRRVFILILFETLKVISVQLAMILHKRHLMMWKVFAPKFVFQSLSFVFLSISLFTFCVIFRNMKLPKYEVFDHKNKGFLDLYCLVSRYQWWDLN